jgi:CBS domain-containing protein
VAIKLSDLFSKPVITAAPGHPLTAVARQMDEHNVGAVVVVEGGRPVGIVTDRDLALALGARGVGAQTPVEQVMTSEPQTIPAGASVLTATRYLREWQVRRLPMVDNDGRLVGIVCLDDLLRYLARELSNLAEGIRDEMLVG